PITYEKQVFLREIAENKAILVEEFDQEKEKQGLSNKKQFL
ncbi:16056_t:CDS:1, partial [Gigaspora margarita]